MTTNETTRDTICDGTQIVRAENIDWEYELPDERLIYTHNYSEEAIRNEIGDGKIIDDISPSMIVALGNNRDKLVIAGERPHHYQDIRASRKTGIYFTIHTEFPNESEEVKDELRRLGEGSAIWERLKELQ